MQIVALDLPTMEFASPVYPIKLPVPLPVAVMGSALQGPVASLLPQRAHAHQMLRVVVAVIAQPITLAACQWVAPVLSIRIAMGWHAREESVAWQPNLRVCRTRIVAAQGLAHLERAVFQWVALAARTLTAARVNIAPPEHVRHALVMAIHAAYLGGHRVVPGRLV